MAISGGYGFLGTGSDLVAVDIRDPAAPIVVGRAGTGAEALEVQGGYAYVVSRGLQVFDVSNPAKPRRAGSTNTADYARAVALLSSYAYLAADSGLQVLDISNPSNPMLVGRTNVGGGPRSVAVAGNYAYEGIGFRLQVFDVSSPANPVPIAATNLNGSPETIALSGNYAYVGVDASLQIFDISIPANPVRVGGTSTLNSVNEIALSGAYAYLATGSGIEVIDISNPANPMWLSRTGNWAIALGVSGNHAVLGGSGIQVFDISSPANPVIIGALPAAPSILGVAQLDNYDYLADQYAGLQVINVSNPANPFRVGGYHDYNKAAYPFEIAVSGNYAYMLDYTNGLQVFSISNPASPALLGACAFTNTARRLAVSGNKAYVTMDRGNYSNGVHYYAGLSIVDVSVATNPVTVGTYWTTNRNAYVAQAGGVVVSNDYAYLTYAGRRWDPEFGDTSIGDVEVINVSNPANPVLAGRERWGAFYYFYESWDVALSGNYAYAIFHYVARPPTYGEDGGVALVDVSNPNNPFWVESPPGSFVNFRTLQNHSQVVSSGNYLWLVGGSPDLRVVDISNPTNLVLVASNDTGGLRIAVSGQYAYAASGSGGLQIFCLDCPRLSAELAGGQVLLKWPTNAVNFTVERAATVAAAQWQPQSGTPQVQAGYYVLAVPTTNSAAFFRLRGP